MASFDYINSQEFYEVCKLAGQSFIEERRNISSVPLDQILFMCKTYLVIIDKESGILKFNKSGKINKRSNQNKDNYRMVQLFGGKLLYKLREFLLNEQIYYLLGGHGPKGGNLGEKLVPQNAMLEGLRASLSSNALVLNHNLESLQSFNILTNDSIADMWQQILNWGINITRNKSSFKQIPRKPTKKDPDPKRPVYQNVSKDSNVYMGFANKQPLWYYIEGGSQVQYNRGWLYEWYRAQTLRDTMSALAFIDKLGAVQHPIGLLVSSSGGRENIQGLKAGDFSVLSNALINYDKNAEQQLALGSQVQAKYNNQQIISFHNIKKSINAIYQLLNNYKKGILDINKTTRNVLNVFSTNDYNEINNEYDQLVDETIKKLMGENVSLT